MYSLSEKLDTEMVVTCHVISSANRWWIRYLSEIALQLSGRLPSLVIYRNRTRLCFSNLLCYTSEVSWKTRMQILVVFSRTASQQQRLFSLFASHTQMCSVFYSAGISYFPRKMSTNTLMQEAPPAPTSLKLFFSSPPTQTHNLSATGRALDRSPFPGDS